MNRLMRSVSNHQRPDDQFSESLQFGIIRVTSRNELKLIPNYLTFEITVLRST